MDIESDMPIKTTTAVCEYHGAVQLGLFVTGLCYERRHDVVNIMEPYTTDTVQIL